MMEGEREVDNSEERSLLQMKIGHIKIFLKCRKGYGRIVYLENHVKKCVCLVKDFTSFNRAMKIATDMIWTVRDGLVVKRCTLLMRDLTDG